LEVVDVSSKPEVFISVARAAVLHNSVELST